MYSITHTAAMLINKAARRSRPRPSSVCDKIRPVECFESRDRVVVSHVHIMFALAGTGKTSLTMGHRIRVRQTR